MTTADKDPYAPIKDAWHLYQTMTEPLANEQAQNVIAERPATETWGKLPEQIDATKNALYEYAGPGDTRKERRQHRHERREIEGLNEILDATHTALVNLADAEVDYLKLEQATKEEIAQGAKGDMVSLDMARDKVSKSREALTQSRSTLSYRIENLADETGSGLFTPN